MKCEYAIIVKNKTRLEALTERFNTKSQARFYIEHSGGNFDDYETEHETFHNALNNLQIGLSSIIKNKTIERTFLPSFTFSARNLIVVIGQDGLVANTAKYSNMCPIIAINPDKTRYDGALLPFDLFNYQKGVESVLSGTYRANHVSFAEASLNNGQQLLAFNDLFIGTSSHSSARYRISFKGHTEEHSSSGIIVSTAIGSTGWLSSIFNMVYGIAGLYEDDLEPVDPSFRYDQLMFAVREPFLSIRTQTDIVSGLVDNQHTLTIESLMPANGVIFSDGVETDFLQFNSGATVKIGVSSRGAVLIQK